ncbi:MAG: metallopeptidase family protein [Planctomycetota bacterium]
MDDLVRMRFDQAVARVIAALPDRERRLIEHELAVILEDRPSETMLIDLGMDPADPASEELLGLFTGAMRTEASIEESGPPSVIHLFRHGLTEVARDEHGNIREDVLNEEIRITLLHELGHYYGLEEDDLEGLGYG